jgi:hypothetical protein
MQGKRPGCAGGDMDYIGIETRPETDGAAVSFL